LSKMIWAPNRKDKVLSGAMLAEYEIFSHEISCIKRLMIKGKYGYWIRILKNI